MPAADVTRAALFLVSQQQPTGRSGYLAPARAPAPGSGGRDVDRTAGDPDADEPHLTITASGTWSLAEALVPGFRLVRGGSGSSFA